MEAIEKASNAPAVAERRAIAVKPSVVRTQFPFCFWGECLEDFRLEEEGREERLVGEVGKATKKTSHRNSKNLTLWRNLN
jgi:hypothetical protein